LDGRVAWFGDADVRRLAGAQSYKRGLDYLTAVSPLDELPNGVTSTVEGTDTYEVRLLDDDGGLAGECTCPYGQGGALCKHCVAVALTLLAHDAPPKRRRKPRAKTDLRGYLMSVDRAEFVDLLLELANEDAALYRRLSLRAATSGDLDVSELRRLVDGLRSLGFVDYRGSFGYAKKANDVLDAIDRVATDHPGTVGSLYLRAAQHLTKASEQADDSAGVIGDASSRAVEAYAAACRAAPPDPVELANWMIDFQLNGPGWPEVPIADFAEALGPDGLAAYWSRLVEFDGDDRRFTITHLREEYLKNITGDVDALIALYAEELPQAYQYVRIGETLRDARRPADAIAWLRRGLAEADRPDSRIPALLAELLTTTGRHAEALDCRWTIFAGRPDVGTHRSLRDAAERADALAETGERALAHLRERAARKGYHADPLVTILLSIGDIDGAWAAANAYDCGPGCYFLAAERRAATHPGDAIPAYARKVEETIDRKNKQAYAEAAELLRVVRKLHRQAGTDFAAYLAGVKDKHRQKRTFLAELARAGL
jgi:uncharacterized Zn finger protein